jgi:hypothetical protein
MSAVLLGTTTDRFWIGYRSCPDEAFDRPERERVVLREGFGDAPWPSTTRLTSPIESAFRRSGRSSTTVRSAPSLVVLIMETPSCSFPKAFGFPAVIRW